MNRVGNNSDVDDDNDVGEIDTLEEVLTSGGGGGNAHPDTGNAETGSTKSLIQLAQENNVEELTLELKRLNKSGSLDRLINEPDAKKMTPLHYAARYGNVNAIKVLIGFGADVNAEDGNGMTPIHYTAR
jgi:ankyrin repeat protein